MTCSMQFAIPVTEENRELIQHLFYGLDADTFGREKDHVFMFTINRSGHVGHRRVRHLDHIHIDDDDRCTDNTVRLLEVSKI